MTEARPTTHGTGPAAPGRRPDPPRPSTHPASGPHPLPRQPDAAADHDGADGRGQAYAAPARAPLADARGPREPTTRLTSHGCWYPSADPGGDRVAFICDRGGVPQLWAGPVAGDDVRLLDAGPDPVREVSWSPDGRWIAYTTAPGGGEHTRVLCVRPDGTDRHILAGAEPGTSAYLGCWAHDGSALAVTVAVPTAPYAAPVTVAAANGDTEGLPAGWSSRDGTAVLLGTGARYDTGTTTPAPAPPSRPSRPSRTRARTSTARAPRPASRTGCPPTCSTRTASRPPCSSPPRPTRRPCACATSAGTARSPCCAGGRAGGGRPSSCAPPTPPRPTSSRWPTATRGSAGSHRGRTPCGCAATPTASSPP